MTYRSLPEVHRLRLLHEVALHGSLAGAARTAGVTASAVSQQIALLEREAGATLLDRGPRGVVLTGAGERLVEQARSVLSVLTETEAVMAQLGGDPTGTVRVGSIASAAGAIVLTAAERLRHSHPGLTMSVTALEPAESVDAVVAGTLDLAVIDLYDHVPMPFPDYLRTEEVHVEPLVLVGAVGDAPAPCGPDGEISLADLRSTDWVIPPAAAACGAAVRYACRAEGFEPRVTWETDDLLLLVEAVSRGQGVSLLPRLAVSTRVAPVTLHAVAGSSLRRRILTISRSTTHERPTVRAVLEALAHAAPAD